MADRVQSLHHLSLIFDFIQEKGPLMQTLQWRPQRNLTPLHWHFQGNLQFPLQEMALVLWFSKPLVLRGGLSSHLTCCLATHSSGSFGFLT